MRTDYVITTNMDFVYNYEHENYGNLTFPDKTMVREMIIMQCKAPVTPRAYDQVTTCLRPKHFGIVGKS